jgi:hypothetical protein
MTTNELLEVSGATDESLCHEVTAQSTKSSATGASVTVLNCGRLLRYANPPSRGIAFGEWLRGLMRRR